MAAPKCPVCKREFEAKDRRVAGNERTYHAGCFTCGICKRSLVNDMFTEEVQTVEVDVPDMLVPMHVETIQLSCVNCTAKNKYKSCFGCKKRFDVTSTIVRAHRHNWHPQCFRCAGCGELVQQEFFVRDGKHYCAKTTCGGVDLISAGAAPTSPAVVRPDQKTQSISASKK